MRLPRRRPSLSRADWPDNRDGRKFEEISYPFLERWTRVVAGAGIRSSPLGGKASIRVSRGAPARAGGSTQRGVGKVRAGEEEAGP